MGARCCDLCEAKAVMKCGRCTVARCHDHALPPGKRCERCERDWVEDAPTRRSAKLIFVPPLSIFVGGIVLGLLLPVSFGTFGAAIMCTVAFTVAAGVGAIACKLVDRNARALFLRERSGGLPAARLLPSPRR